MSNTQKSENSKEKPEGSSFSYETVVKEELIIEHEDGPFGEPDSPEPDNSSEETAKIDRRRKFETLRCEDCDKTFTNNFTFYTHTLRHRNLKACKYFCEYCKQPFISGFALKKHERNFHAMHQDDDEPAKGKRSAKSISPKVVVKRNEDGLFKCSECGKSFEQRCQYTRHLNSHAAKKLGKFQCEMCERCFGSRADLGNHKLTHEKNEAAMTDYTLAKQRPSIDVREEGGLFKCSECGSVFEQRFMCVRHIWRHNLQKPEFFVCGTCQKQFNKRSNLVRHEAMHEREKAEPPKPKKPPKFHCDKCQRPFWKRHNLNRHQLVHDKEEANSKGQTIEAYLKS
ncbi:hypothetical protein quinque_011385 [Culex quinquefasciatus]